LTLDMEFKDTLKYILFLDENEAKMHYTSLLGLWTGKVKGELITANILRYKSDVESILDYSKMAADD